MWFFLSCLTGQSESLGILKRLRNTEHLMSKELSAIKFDSVLNDVIYKMHSVELEFNR